VAGFAAGSYRPSPGRGTSPGFRFTLYAILAIALMFFDQRRGWLEQTRYYLSGAAYPIQLAVNSPTAAWRWLESTFEARATLQAENTALLERVRALELKTQRYEALARENGELRGLRSALPPVADRWLVAEVVNVALNSLQQRILIDRGARNGVFKGQAVMDSQGLIGQTMHVGPWSAEVILLTDPENEVPVQVERTGVRTITVGTGDSESLALPYLPANADIRPGDLLVTSGLGGVFPQGYPVARVITVHHGASRPVEIRARPLAELDKLHEVMLVWFRPNHPAAPRPFDNGQAVSRNLPAGDPAFQPQMVPTHPSAAEPAHPAAAKSAPARHTATVKSAPAASRPRP
jgi:rod shape-determining protein MreC